MFGQLVNKEWEWYDNIAEKIYLDTNPEIDESKVSKLESISRSLFFISNEISIFYFAL